MTYKKKDKEKEVDPVKKLFSWAVIFAVACILINWGIRLLADVWLPLLLLGALVIVALVVWRVQQARKWRE